MDERQRLAGVPEQVLAPPKGARTPELALQVRRVPQLQALDLAVQLDLTPAEIDPDGGCGIQEVLLHLRAPDR